MKSVMTASQHFAQVPRAEIERSSFNRDRGYKTTFSSGYLIPFFCDEVLPGDTYKVNANLLTRLLSPLRVPVMDNIFLDTFFFFIPNRLVWDNWKAFMGEKKTDDTTDYVVPTVVAPATTGFAVGSLYDYLGVPTGIPGIEISSLFHRAYNLVFREWFMDQNLMGTDAHGYPVVDVDDGTDTVTDYVLRRRCKRPDYFSSCLPWPQKSDAVSLPLGGDAPVLGIGKLTNSFNAGAANGVYESDGTTSNYATSSWIDSTSGDNAYHVEQDGSTGYPNIRADLSAATAYTINSLREAFQLQRLLERDARGGTRYAEVIMSHFGVTDPQHAVLQRPVYLGGSSQPISTQIVPQTTATGLTGGSTAQGNLSAYGIGASLRNGFTHSFTEHGIILGLLNVRADLTYQQGLDRMFSRSTRYDFYFPALAHLGEQAVLNQEIYAQGTGHTADDAGVFGYQERYAEYRYGISKITGQLRSTYATSLDIWHLSQEFESLPTLGRDFIEENPPIGRISAVTTTDQFVLDSFIQCNCVRPMPIYSVPGLIDHF